MGAINEIAAEIQQFEKCFGIRVLDFLKKRKEFDDFRAAMDASHPGWLELVKASEQELTT